MTNETTNNNNEPIATLAPGTVLNNKYELIKQVSNDAMGAVWKAKDRVADRTVALKFVPNELRQNESEMNQIREMFKRVHALQHPSICALYGLEDGGHLGYYFVMRYLKGETLAQYAERNDPHRKGLPMSNVIRILSWGVAGALDHAHRSGVIHCNIDPSNIFLAKTERGAEVLVTDFGLAAVIKAGMNRAGLGKINLSGTRPYMAPEQWRGQKPTATTDQYSLAITAYRLLAGHPPFDGTDVEILGNAVLNHKPEPIPLQTDGINAVLQRALAKHGSDRYGSCEEFITELKEGAPALLDVSSLSVVENESLCLSAKSAAADVAFRPAVGSYVHTSSDTSRIWIIVGCVSALFLLGIIAWGVMEGRDKTPPAEVVVQVAPQPVVVEQIVPPAPPQPAYQSPFKDIFEAAEKGLVRDVEYFIKNGANVNARSNAHHSKTSLFIAAEHNSIEVVKYLVSQGADVNAKTTGMAHTLLHFATQNPNLEIVQYFVSQGADVNAKNEFGYAPINEVVRHNPNIEVLRYLVSQGANVNTKNNDGMTPLHHAAEMVGRRNLDNVETARYLVSQGADVNARNNNGRTPLDVAKGRGSTRIAAYLESIGAKSGQ